MFIGSHKLEQATGAPFNQRGHNIGDMQVLILEKYMLKMGPTKRRERKMFMHNHKLDQATGAHFNQRGHNIAAM